MAGPRLDRRTLSKAKPIDLIRLAKFLRITAPPDDCVCDSCNIKLVEAVVRKLDLEESWPPKLLERRW